MFWDVNKVIIIIIIIINTDTICLYWYYLFVCIWKFRMFFLLLLHFVAELSFLDILNTF